MSKAIGNIDSHYQILGLPKDASLFEIEIAYSLLIEEVNSSTYFLNDEDKKYHILELTKSFSILSNPLLREKYDKTLDYDIVVLDKDIDKTDLAEISREYKIFSSKNYDSFMKNFKTFKKEMNESLWLLKTTSIFFFFNILISFIFVYSLIFLSHQLDPKSKFHEYLTVHSITWAFLIVLFNFIIFRIYWQSERSISNKSKK